jgi:hypothetical protein
MKSNKDKDIPADSVPVEDRQSRREFLNGLGKWSMIVVAAVSGMRESIAQISIGDGTERPEWKSPQGSFNRLAKKKHHQHVDIGTGHIDTPHQDVPHVDYRIQQGGGSSGRPSNEPTRSFE